MAQHNNGGGGGGAAANSNNNGGAVECAAAATLETDLEEDKGSEEFGSTVVNAFLTFKSQTQKAVLTKTRIPQNTLLVRRRKIRVSTRKLATRSARISPYWSIPLMECRVRRPGQQKNVWHLVWLGNGRGSV